MPELITRALKIYLPIISRNYVMMSDYNRWQRLSRQKQKMTFNDPLEKVNLRRDWPEVGPQFEINGSVKFQQRSRSNCVFQVPVS